MIDEEDYNTIVYPKICHGQALLDHLRRTTNMLTVSLFNGSTKIHDKLIRNVPQSHAGKRHLIMLAVIHAAHLLAVPSDAKVMLYRDISDPNHFWIRKESAQGGENGRTNYSETECEDAITALGGFEASVRSMLNRLMDRESPEASAQKPAPMAAAS